MKSPLEYFEAQDFSALPPVDAPLSEAEKVFMQKYLGVGTPEAFTLLPAVTDATNIAPTLFAEAKTMTVSVDAQVSVTAIATLDQVTDSTEQVDSEYALRNDPCLQLVGFYIGRQLYTIPTVMVQEVIRTLPLCRLPMISRFVSGVINLRGRVTPLVKLRELLDVDTEESVQANNFTIICRSNDLQVGLQIDKVHSIYRVDQHKIQWNIEAAIGINGDCITGIFELDDKLVPIVSIKRIIDTVLTK